MIRKIGMVLAAAVVSVVAFSATNTAVNANPAPHHDSFCSDRAGHDFLDTVRFSVPDDFSEWSGQARGEWFNLQNRFVVMYGFLIYGQTNVYQQYADVCTPWEAMIAHMINTVVLEHFLAQDSRFHPTGYHCETGDLIHYWNNGGLDGNGGGLFSEWSDGCSWDSDTYANPIEQIEADLGISFAELFEQRFAGHPHGEWTEEHEAMLVKRYFDPAVTPCSTLGTVYDACAQLEALGIEH